MIQQASNFYRFQKADKNIHSIIYLLLLIEGQHSIFVSQHFSRHWKYISEQHRPLPDFLDFKFRWGKDMNKQASQ